MMQIQPCANPRSRRRRSAFTLLEVLVVVAIIVMLAGMAVGVMSYLERAREDTAVINASTVKKAMLDYKIRNGDWPQGGLNDLVNEGTLKADNLLDPWKQPYQWEPAASGRDDDVVVYTTRNNKRLQSRN